MGELQRLIDVPFKQGDALSHKRERYARIAATKGRRTIKDMIGCGKGERVAIVGSGPSLKATVGELRHLVKWAGYRVITLNTAHDWLLNNAPDIPIWAHTMLDPRPWVKGYVTPQKGTIYMLSGQVHPDVWPRFDGFDARVFYNSTTGDDEDYLSKRMRHTKGLWVRGGNTIGLRTFMLTRPEWFAFDHVRLFGFDSSFADDKTHVAPKAADVNVDQTRNTLRLSDPMTGKPLGTIYETNASMMLQCRFAEQEFHEIAKAQLKGIYTKSFSWLFHGTGFLPDWASLWHLHANPSRRDEVLNAPWQESKHGGPAIIYDQMDAVEPVDQGPVDTDALAKIIAALETGNEQVPAWQ